MNNSLSALAATYVVSNHFISPSCISNYRQEKLDLDKCDPVCGIS